jgi:hypothetical protein
MPAATAARAAIIERHAPMAVSLRGARRNVPDQAAKHSRSSDCGVHLQRRVGAFRT